MTDHDDFLRWITFLPISTHAATYNCGTKQTADLRTASARQASILHEQTVTYDRDKIRPDVSSRDLPQNKTHRDHLTSNARGKDFFTTDISPWPTQRASESTACAKIADHRKRC
jgi:hypothetical protein